jgi:hypothetical protein
MGSVELYISYHRDHLLLIDSLCGKLFLSLLVSTYENRGRCTMSVLFLCFGLIFFFCEIRVNIKRRGDAKEEAKGFPGAESIGMIEERKDTYFFSS